MKPCISVHQKCKKTKNKTRNDYNIHASKPKSDFTDMHVCVQPIHNNKTEKKKGKIRNGALPLGMAVCPGLCWSSVTLSSTAREGEGGRRGKKRGEEMVNREKQVRHIEISLFYYLLLRFFYFFFLFGNSRISGEISAAFDRSTCGLGIRISLSYV